MIKETAYCQRCDNDVEFYTKKIQQKATVRNKTFTFTFLEAYCKKCGERVYPVSVGRLNSIALFDGYKKANHLLTSAEIIAIRKKKNLTQKQFASKLGCGEKTITRYENGAIQDRSIDNLIRAIGEEKASVQYFDNNEDVIILDGKKPRHFFKSTDYENISYKVNKYAKAY